MALRLTLKPHERVIVGGAVIRNGKSRSELLIENEVPVLRESDILSPSSVRTPCERIHLALQLMYVDPERLAQHRAAYEELVSEVLEAAPSLAPSLQAIQEQVVAGRIYQALKCAHGLLHLERELVPDVQ
jgi:flagellar biosynthesis repressor protein FlbT